ncbi:MAG: peptide ABC transporter substrate-binding protein [Ktedonobacterales bacterium]
MSVSGQFVCSMRWVGQRLWAALASLLPRLNICNTCAVVVLLLTVLLAACSSTPTNNTPPQPVADSQQILHDQLDPHAADLATRDPALVRDAASLVPIELTFPGLVALDAHLIVQDWAAESVDVSADGLTYIFHLRNGIKFSNGDPINANTFAYSLNRALDPCLASPTAYYLYDIKGAIAFNTETCLDAANDVVGGPMVTLVGAGQPLNPTDPQTLVITLAQPAAYFLTELTYPVADAVPEALVKQYGASDWTNHLIGVGGSLFEFAVDDHNGMLKLTRNPAFWGTKPRLREIDYTIYKNPTSAYNDYLNGKSDIGYPPSALYTSARAQPDFHETNQLQILYLGLNWKVAPFDDVSMRQAFALAVNKTTIATKTLDGAVSATNHIVPEGMPGYNADLRGPGSASGVSGNTTLAHQLASAYAAAHCGGSFAHCPAVTLNVVSRSPQALAVVTAVKAMWQAVMPGYPITIRQLDYDMLTQGIGGASLQSFYASWTPDYPDAQNWLSLHFGVNAPYNATNAVDANANTLMSKADAETDPTQRAKDYQAAEQLLVNDVAWLPLAQGKLFWRVRSSVVNYIEDAQGTPSIVDGYPSIYIARQ